MLLLSEARSRADDEHTLSLGFSSIKGLRLAAAGEMLAARQAKAFTSVEDFLRRTNLSAKERRALAGTGALNALSGHRRVGMRGVESQGSNDELFLWAVAWGTCPSYDAG